MTIDGGVGAGFTVTLICLVPDPATFVAVTANENAPAGEGVPLKVPAEEFSASPGGSVPAVTVQVNGVVPVAASVCE